MRRAQPSARKPLSNLEQTIMQTVWRHPGCTADDVRLALEAEHPLKESTVRTLLRRLEAKGYLAHDVDGRTFQYRAVSAPQQVAASAVRRIIDRFCNGSLEQLLVGLVESEMVDGKELQRLAARVEQQRETHAAGADRAAVATPAGAGRSLDPGATASPREPQRDSAADSRISRRSDSNGGGNDDNERGGEGGKARGTAGAKDRGKEKAR